MKTQPDSTCEYRTPTHCFPTAHFIPGLTLDWVATAESLSLFLLNSVTAVRQVKKQNKNVIICLLSKRYEIQWATPLLFLGYLTFKCVFCTSVHLCLFTSCSPPHSAVYLTIVVFSVPPNRAFLSSGLTSRLSYCRNE